MRSVLHTVLSCIVVVVCWNVGPGSTVADFPELLKHVPETANVVLLMKSKEIAANASLSASNQIEQFLGAARSWPVVAKWEPQQIVIASEMDIQHMAPAWEMAAISLGKEPNLSYLAGRTRGVVDQLMDFDLVWLDNACALATGEKQLTFVSPLNRQSATRWLRRIKNQDSIQLSPYLADSAEAAVSNKAEIIMMIDFENFFAPAAVEQAVANSPLFKKIDTNPSNILSGFRGLTINCQVGAHTISSINFDFAASAEPLEPIAKELVMGAISKAGAMLGEFENWEVKVKGNQISIEGKLSPASIGKILGILSIDSIVSQADDQTVEAESEPDVPADPQQAGQPTAAEKNRIMRATQRYFRNVQNALREVQEGVGKATPEQSALWATNAARRISQISTRNVDPKMIDYGQYVANALNDMVYGVHQAVNQTRAEANTDWAYPAFGGTTVTAIPYRSVNWGGRRRFSYAPMVSSNLNLGANRIQRRNQRDAEVGSGNVQALSIMREIDNATNQIRTAMSEKYGSGF